MIEWVIRERGTILCLRGINFFSIAQNSLRIMGRRQIFTVGNIDEIRKCKQEEPDAGSTQSLTR